MVLCRENAMPIVVFDVSAEGALVAISRGEDVGTRVQMFLSESRSPGYLNFRFQDLCNKHRKVNRQRWDQR